MAETHALSGLARPADPCAVVIFGAAGDLTRRKLLQRPGPTVQLNNVKLDFSDKDFGETSAATGYERLLYDAMIGDGTLFHRSDMVDAAWKIATPILDVWKALPPRDFPNYPAGLWGPAAADDLIQRDGRKWWNPESQARAPRR